MHIFFDVDGVLINGFHARMERRQRWDLHMKRDIGVCPDKFQEIFTSWFPEVIQGRRDFQTELSLWLAAHHYDISAQTIIDYWNKTDSLINRPVYDAAAQLSTRGDIRLYLATNQTHERARYLWNDLGFKNHFRDIYYSARLGFLKTDTNYFAQIESELSIDPQKDEILYFDDDKRNIDVAMTRGWNAILFDTAEDCLNHTRIQSLLAA